ncbi:MAG: LD-carboxypeptidase [Candidatus Gracilibacteria bacterium]|jgi:muramoyltetrapeptide carboxypeptidase LdcA involved in peptidoglycan recycling|nr:LD-carboxypeptidase [Candidatus Gracilibacteria bacterium]
MIPEKLKEGDEIRIIAPARSINLPFISEEVRILAKKRLENMGLAVSFGKHIFEKNNFDSSSIIHRIEDLHEAFANPKIKMILTVIGGFNSNELLPYIDYDLIKKNPKILCGYSDITALENGIYAMTGLTTYSGPHFFDFGEKIGFDYTMDYFKRALFSAKNYEIIASEKWSCDLWANIQQNRNFHNNTGHYVLNEGKAEGILIGGNLVTLHSLLGSPYFPDIKNSILFLEEDEEENKFSFNRNLTSLTLLNDFKYVNGLILGRFNPKSEINKKELDEIIANNPKLKNIPIIGGLDFGHTTPRLTLPIGGKVKLESLKDQIVISINNH